jgi:hypothetical protein
MATERSHDAARDDGRKKSQAEVLLTLAHAAGVELWGTPEGEPYATLAVESHREHHRLAARTSRDWLARLFFHDQGRPPNAQALHDALGVLRGEALWGGGERREAYVRHAVHEDAIYIDLGDPEWRAIEIDRDGWRIVSDPPTRFRRPRGLLPLPEPTRGGSLDALRGLLNVGDEAWVLVCGWLVGATAPSGPYPVLALHGEQGAAKSTAARLLRGLTDPNVAPLRSEPRDERDLAIAARNGWIVALDNLSRLPNSLSDALCRLATGGGFATRELYSDAEEVLFSATRPAIITGITEVASRGDLLDRSLLVSLGPIPETDRLTEAELEKRWEEIGPVALGGLLDATATALRRLPNTHLDRLPRLADHARWVTAAEPALGWDDGAYLRVFGRARTKAVEQALDASPLTDPIRELACEGWEGSASELLTTLSTRCDDMTVRSRAWPRSARGLSAALKRLAPDLRSAGIEVEWSRTAGSGSRRVLAVRECRAPSVANDATAPPTTACDASDASPDTHPDAATREQETEVERIAEKFGIEGIG